MAIRKCVVAVPARLRSSRLPNKVLADIGGKPMIQRVLERCREARSVEAVVLCTDSTELQTLAEGWGFPVLMTAESCNSGSERIASVAHPLMALGWGDADPVAEETAVINVQGDQPFIDPAVIDAMAEEFRRQDPVPAVVTPVYGLKPESVHNPNVVKTLLAHDGRALCISPAPPSPMCGMWLRRIGMSTPPTGGMWACTASGEMCWPPGISCRPHRWRIWNGSNSCG